MILEREIVLVFMGIGPLSDGRERLAAFCECEVLEFVIRKLFAVESLRGRQCLQQ